jgi:leucyl aminopeptidase
VTYPTQILTQLTDLDSIADWPGNIAMFVDTNSTMDKLGRRVNKLTKGTIQRLIETERFSDLAEGEVIELTVPHGLTACAVLVVKLDKRSDKLAARKAGAAISKKGGAQDCLVLLGNHQRTHDILLGAQLRQYSFLHHKTKPSPKPVSITAMVNEPDEVDPIIAEVNAISDGVFFTRDLVSEPANVLTTEEFATRLLALKDLGVKVEVLDEPQLEELGMGSLLGVGLGSETPTKVVIMEWNGGGDEEPFAIVGKGVVFDTGGISIKPAGGMEEMTMDMGGAGVVSGLMKTLATRGAKANIVGLVGLVENMPDGKAQRPGDVVTSMKGDTIEVINTDAEGRLVLADVMWHAQERFNPTGMINLATLTGAIIIALGHENAGVFSNNDDLCNAFLQAAEDEGEGAWRMPLGQAYDKMLKSNIADMKNIGGRPAGSVTAAQFIQRFVKETTPWIHLDIAGVALVNAETTLAPRGATGWGVMALDRLIKDKFEA